MTFPKWFPRHFDPPPPDVARYTPKQEAVFEVALVEFPRPPESAAPSPVFVKANGPVDACLKVGPSFDALLASRRTRPLAYLTVKRDGVQLKLFTPQDAPERTEETDEENGR